MLIIPRYQKKLYLSYHSNPITYMVTVDIMRVLIGIETEGGFLDLVLKLSTDVQNAGFWRGDHLV